MAKPHVVVLRRVLLDLGRVQSSPCVVAHDAVDDQGQIEPQMDVRRRRSRRSIDLIVHDGIVGNNTWGRLDPPQIQKNSPQHNYVRLCQLILKSFAVPAFDPGPADGIFGPNTETAVKAFQAIFATPADGIVGPKTWRALRS